MAPLTRNRAGPGQVPSAIAVDYYRQRRQRRAHRHARPRRSAPRARATSTRRASTTPRRWPAGGASPTPCTPRAGGSSSSCGMSGASRIVVAAAGRTGAGVVDGAPARTRRPSPATASSTCRRRARCATSEIPEVVASLPHGGPQRDRSRLRRRRGPRRERLPDRPVPARQHQRPQRRLRRRIANRTRLLLEVMQAVAAEIGGGRTGLRLSPVTPSNDAGQDSDPQALFDHALAELAPLRLAFVARGRGPDRRRARLRAVRLRGAAPPLRRRLDGQQRLHAGDGAATPSPPARPTWSPSAGRSSATPTSCAACARARRSARPTRRPSTRRRARLHRLPFAVGTRGVTGRQPVDRHDATSSPPAAHRRHFTATTIRRPWPSHACSCVASSHARAKPAAVNRVTMSSP